MEADREEHQSKLATTCSERERNRDLIAKGERSLPITFAKAEEEQRATHTERAQLKQLLAEAKVRGAAREEAMRDNQESFKR